MFSLHILHGPRELTRRNSSEKTVRRIELILIWTEEIETSATTNKRVNGHVLI